MKSPIPKKRITRRRKTNRKSPYSRFTPATTKRWNDLADKMLTHCQQVHDLAQGFDTTVRDSVTTGLAYVVHAAFDCRAIAHNFADFESYNAFIDGSTAEWFRQRGYTEWFCSGAAALFHTTPNRTLAKRQIAVVSTKR